MIELHIGFHGQTHRIAFGDRAAAQAELDKLLPLLGRDKWGSNGKPEAPTHTIMSPTGDFVVVLEKVETARLIDTTANDDLYRAPTRSPHTTRTLSALSATESGCRKRAFCCAPNTECAAYLASAFAPRLETKMTTTEVHDPELDAACAALAVLAEHGIPPDVQELLVVGNPSLGIAPGALSRAIKAVIVSFKRGRD